MSPHTGFAGDGAIVSETQLLTKRDAHVGAVLGGSVYIIGGARSNGSLDTLELLGGVERAQVNGSSVDMFKSAGIALQTPRYNPQGLTVGNSVLVLGGATWPTYNGTLASIERSVLDSTGKLGPFMTLPFQLANRRMQFSADLIGKYVYAVGGWAGGIHGSVERAEIDPCTGDLKESFYPVSARLTVPRYAHASAVIGNHLYVVGGMKVARRSAPSSARRSSRTDPSATSTFSAHPSTSRGITTPARDSARRSTSWGSGAGFRSWPGSARRQAA